MQQPGLPVVASSFHRPLLGKVVPQQLSGASPRWALTWHGTAALVKRRICASRRCQVWAPGIIVFMAGSGEVPLVVFQLPLRPCHALPELVLHGCLGFLPPSLQHYSVSPTRPKLPCVF